MSLVRKAPPSSLRSVIFDFDYTLADSSPAVLECARVALEGIGLPQPSDEAILRTIGLSLPDTLAALAGEEHRPRAEEFRAHWRRRSDQIMVARTTILPGVREALAMLRGAGLRLGIVSTKFRGRIEATLQREGLQGRFDAVVGGDDVAECKPHPQGLYDALEKLETEPEMALYAGDSLTDAETALRASVAFAAVFSGATRPEEFTPYPLAMAAKDVRELAAILVRGASGASSLAADCPKMSA